MTETVSAFILFYMKQTHTTTMLDVVLAFALLCELDSPQQTISVREHNVGSALEQALESWTNMHALSEGLAVLEQDMNVSAYERSEGRQTIPVGR